MDELSASHWDDVVTSSTMSHLYSDILHENGFKDDDDDDEEVEDSSLQLQQQEEDESQQENSSKRQSQDDDEEDTREILSSLTGNIPLSPSTTTTKISKNDNLFNNVDVGDIEVDENSDAIVSPVKKRSTKIMYKPPRFRRSVQAKAISGGDSDEVGPLKLVEDDEDDDVITAQSSLKRDKLINSIDKPLFEINSTTKYSPIKTNSKANNKQEEEPIQIEEAEYHFEISVGDPHKIGSELLNAHIQYSVTTKSNLPIFQNAPVDEIVVERRYNDFLWLYNQLHHNHPGIIIPPPPEKQAVGRFNKNFIENRRLSLEKMLINISKNAILQKDQDFVIFLTSDKFNDESKYREHNFEIVDENTSADGGLLSSLITGAFSSAPKYVEQDLYFIDQQQYIENLDYNLKNLYKSLELITGTRNDLIISIEEFNKFINKMGLLEINNEISLIFNNYNGLIEKIQDNVERFSMSEMLTIGNTIDEYIRIIQSIRMIFNQRVKLVSQLSLNEANLAKKQKNLSKFKLKFHNQLDKIEKYELEITDLEKLIQQETIKKDELINRIKQELSIFNIARLNDFKNSFEIYWESLIESQKELIELWETFYDNCKF